MTNLPVDVKLEIFKDGKRVTFLQLEKQYQEWIFQMHGHYDEEIECGEDQPILVVSPSNKKRLGISSESKFSRSSTLFTINDQVRLPSLFIDEVLLHTLHSFWSCYSSSFLC